MKVAWALLPSHQSQHQCMHITKAAGSHSLVDKMCRVLAFAYMPLPVYATVYLSLYSAQSFSSHFPVISATFIWPISAFQCKGSHPPEKIADFLRLLKNPFHPPSLFWTYSFFDQFLMSTKPLLQKNRQNKVIYLFFPQKVFVCQLYVVKRPLQAFICISKFATTFVTWVWPPLHFLTMLENAMAAGNW